MRSNQRSLIRKCLAATQGVGLVVLAVGCGSKNSGDSYSQAIGLIALSSPTAATSSSLLQAGYVPSSEASSGDAKPADEQIAALEKRLDESSEASCVAGLALAFKNKPNLTCFGAPFVVNTAYDRSGGVTFVNTVSGGTFNGWGSHPSGDAGVLLASEALTGEACSAATVNAYVAYASQGLRLSQDLMSAGLCVAKVKNLKLPEIVGDKLDLTVDLATAMAAVATITKTEIVRSGTDANGNPVFSIELAGNASGKAFSVSSANTKSSEGSSGQVRGYFDVSADATPKYFGFSVDYSKSGDSMSLEYRAARNRNSSSFDFFNATTGKVDFSKGSTSIGEDLFFIKFKGSSASGARDGSMVFAWQAGEGDSHSRVFQADVKGTVGTGFYSYGYKLNAAGATESNFGKIEGMICNWVLTQNGSVPSHAAQAATHANKAMKQTMTLTGGKFVAATSNIGYAPHHTCNGHVADYTMTLVSGNSGANFAALTVTGATRTVASGFVNDLQTVSSGMGLDADRVP